MSRHYRELSAAVEAGFEVKVLAGVLSSPSESGSIDEANGFEVHRFDPFPKSKVPYASTARAKKSIFEKVKRFFLNFIFVIRYAKKARSFHADVISCHDISGLFIGYLSNIFLLKAKKAKLIYDSLEFEIGRNETRNFLISPIVLIVERFLIKRSVLAVMVNDSIADEVARIHKLKTRPLVIRSTPPNWKIDESVCEKQRQEYIRLANASFEPFFVMYHGLIKNSRGIETLIHVVSMNSNIVAVILAVVRDENYFSKIKRLVDEYGVTDRILFLPAVPINRLWEFVGAADVGVSILKNTCINHYFCLNNKFFESIQSLTPVIVSDFPELSRIVNHYDIGLTCDPASVDEINACIERMRTDKELYAKFKKNLVAAKEELCWEREKEGLVAAYKDLYDEVLREKKAMI